MMRVTRIAVGATLAAMAVAIVPAVTASAGPAASATGLPPAATTKTVTEAVIDATLSCGGHEYTVSLMGSGKLTVGTAIEPFSGGLIIPITTTADHLQGNSVDFGKIDMTETAPVTGELIENSRSQIFPAKESLPLDPVFTVQHDPCDPSVHMLKGVSGDPGPAILRNSNVTNFPPQNDIYQLVEPMDLEDINNPGPVLATIRSFPLTVNPATP